MASSCTPLPEDDVGIAEIGIVGIGNTLMGDDGAGIIVAKKLQELLQGKNNIYIYYLQRDLFEMADILCHARRFIFVDVFLGSPAGTTTIFHAQSPTLMPSIHQTDIGSIMHMLEPLGLIDPFPKWEIHGISIEPPLMLGKELSPLVALAVDKLVCELLNAISFSNPAKPEVR